VTIDNQQFGNIYSGVAPERCLKISTAVLSASRYLSNADISNSIRAIVIRPRRPAARLAVQCLA
jgi:hypothetical protein